MRRGRTTSTSDEHEHEGRARARATSTSTSDEDEHERRGRARAEQGRARGTSTSTSGRGRARATRTSTRARARAPRGRGRARGDEAKRRKFQLFANHNLWPPWACRVGGINSTVPLGSGVHQHLDQVWQSDPLRCIGSRFKSVQLASKICFRLVGKPMNSRRLER